MTFGERLKAAREAKGMKRWQLARRVQLMLADQIEYWESHGDGFLVAAHFSVELLLRLCRALDVSPNWLLGWEEGK